MVKSKLPSSPARARRWAEAQPWGAEARAAEHSSSSVPCACFGGLHHTMDRSSPTSQAGPGSPSSVSRRSTSAPVGVSTRRQAQAGEAYPCAPSREAGDSRAAWGRKGRTWRVPMSSPAPSAVGSIALSSTDRRTSPPSADTAWNSTVRGTPALGHSAPGVHHPVEMLRVHESPEEAPGLPLLQGMAEGVHEGGTRPAETRGQAAPNPEHRLAARHEGRLPHSLARLRVGHGSPRGAARRTWVGPRDLLWPLTRVSSQKVRTPLPPTGRASAEGTGLGGNGPSLFSRPQQFLPATCSAGPAETPRRRGASACRARLPHHSLYPDGHFSVELPQ